MLQFKVLAKAKPTEPSAWHSQQCIILIILILIVIVIVILIFLGQFT